MLLAWMLTFLSLSSFSKPSDLVPCSADTDITYDVTCLRTDKSSCSNTTLKITWDYANLDAGKVNFSILGLSCLPEKYDLRLYRYESSTCNESRKELILKKCSDKNKKCGLEETKLHSIRYISESVGVPCKQVQNVTYDLVYTGKYILEVKRLITSQFFYSDPVCFVTNFKKQSMFNQTISIFSHYQPDSNQMQHTVRNFSRLYVKRLKLVVWQKTSETIRDGQRIILDHIFFKSSGMECKSTDKVACKLQLDKENDRIDCLVENVTAGDHWLQVMLAHDPCKEQAVSVWKESRQEGEVFCDMSGKPEKAIQKNTTYNPTPPETTADSRAVGVLVTLCFVFAIAIAIFTKFLFDRWRRISEVNDMQPQTGDPTLPMVDIPLTAAQPQIYLAYARDCPAFMEMMVLFRNLLKAMNCKVYDCFDPDYSEEIARIGSSWTGKCISSNSVKILFIETRCAKLHFQAHIENFKILYKEPTAWDDYFMSSLKLILQNPEYNSYHKVYVTCVSGFTTEEDKLIEITPYTRYDIPNAMNRLMCSLCQQHNINFPENWNCNKLKLEEAVKNLVNYKTTNQDYLQNFLLRKEINRFQRFISKFRR